MTSRLVLAACAGLAVSSSAATARESDFVPYQDPFVQRFELGAAAQNPYNDEALGRGPTLTQGRKEKLEEFVSGQELLYGAGRPEGLLEQYARASDSADEPLRRLLLKVFFSLIGENAKSPSTREAADLTLKLFAAPDPESFERLSHAYHGRLGRQRELPRLYPAAIEALLSSLRDDGFGSNRNGRALLNDFMSEDAVADSPEFYRSIAGKNPSLRSVLAIRLIGLAADSPDRREELVNLLKTGGRELDEARDRLLGSMLYGGGELLDQAGLVEQVLLIRDHSVVRSLPYAANLFERRGEEKKALLRRHLGAMVEKAPAALIDGLKEFEEFLARDGRRHRFKDVADFYDPFYAEACRRLGREADPRRLFDKTMK